LGGIVDGPGAIDGDLAGGAHRGRDQQEDVVAVNDGGVVVFRGGDREVFSVEFVAGDAEMENAALADYSEAARGGARRRIGLGGEKRGNADGAPPGGVDSPVEGLGLNGFSETW
jgi:hypothetical protein